MFKASNFVFVFCLRSFSTAAISMLQYWEQKALYRGFTVALYV